MVAKDSPLTIDCPMVKRGGISSAHSSLDAAIAKFRMTAYMWQAMIGDDMHSKGLGRRSFRLEDEWAADTLSQAFPHAGGAVALSCNDEQAFRSTAKIHIVRSDKTVAELRQAQWAQQNPSHRKGDLHKYFMSALKQYGGPFTTASNPVVAGLILDSTYSPSRDLILAHAAIGVHNERGISLGIFGSHLTFSWPRFIEEVSTCLMDITPPGDDVANDCGQCNRMWEACAVGQGAFLHMVGAAFGASSSSGMMARGYAQDWPQNFLPSAAFRIGHRQGDDAINKDRNNACWVLQDALTFKLLPHFSLTTDSPVPGHQRNALPTAQVEADEGMSTVLVVTSDVGIASVEFNSVTQGVPFVQMPVSPLRFTLSELESRFERSKALELRVLGMNGKEFYCRNVWKVFSSTSMIRVPGSDVVLKKRAISDDVYLSSEAASMESQWEWAVLFKERGKDGKGEFVVTGLRQAYLQTLIFCPVVPAISIDMRVGCVLDGAIVHFEDRHTSPCGPRWDKTGQHHHFGLQNPINALFYAS